MSVFRQLMMGKKDSSGFSNILKYADTPFLCHFDGNSTNLGNGGYVQILGSATLAGTPSKFGTNSLKVNSWADLSGFPYEPTDKYTVELWAYQPTESVNLLCWTRGGDDRFAYFWVATDITSSEIVITTNTIVRVPIDTSVWHHIAATYDGNQSFNIFIDGILKNTGTAHTVISNTGHYSPDVNTIHGDATCINEYVIHRGIRYTENFVPLEEPYVIEQ